MADVISVQCIFADTGDAGDILMQSFRLFVARTLSEQSDFLE
jgi:hypothetical protein